MNIPVYNTNGDKIKEADAPNKIFGSDRHSAVEFMSILQRLAGLRRGTHCTKTRSEVRGGGRKPFRQKGTGRARQGSSNASSHPGGGVAFGPKPRSYRFSLNRKSRRLALFSALSEKVRNESIRVVEGVKLDETKTKKAFEILATNISQKTLIVYDPVGNGEIGLALANTADVLAIPYAVLNVYDILNSSRVIVTSEAFEGIKEVWA